MKKILFALALIAAFDTAASAQTSRSSRTVRSRTTVTAPEATPVTSRTTRTTRSVRVTTLPGATVARQRKSNAQGYTRPSPYLGDATPANDGQMNNKQRNLRVNNTSEPLPTNAGW